MDQRTVSPSDGHMDDAVKKGVFFYWSRQWFVCQHNQQVSCGHVLVFDDVASFNGTIDAGRANLPSTTNQARASVWVDIEQIRT